MDIHDDNAVHYTRFAYQFFIFMFDTIVFKDKTNRIGKPKFLYFCRFSNTIEITRC